MRGGAWLLAESPGMPRGGAAWGVAWAALEEDALSCARTQGRTGPKNESWARSSLSAGICACRQLCEIQRTGPWHSCHFPSRPHPGFGTFAPGGGCQPYEHRGRVTGPLFNPGNWSIIFLIVFVSLIENENQ